MAVREEIDLFGGPELVFGCRHLPSEASGAGVLVCLGAPFDPPVDDGRAARLGRRLAGAGVAVQRFQYRGSWPSEGDARRIGFADLVADATQALELLRDRAGVRRVAFLGARLGALVAARVARNEPAAPVALWTPDPDPRTTLEHAARARVARGAHVGADRPSSGPAAPPHDASAPDQAATAAPDSPPVDGSWHDGDASDRSSGPLPGDEPGDSFDLFDTPLAVDLAGGTAVRALTDELGTGPRAVFLAAAGTAGREAIVAGCRARGLTVDAVAHTYDGERDGQPVPGAPSDTLVDDTARWLVAQLATGATRAGAAP
jgi:alpha/beta superfamily hydrolase